MRPDIDYVKNKFREYNELIFARYRYGKLPECEVRITSAGRSLGLFSAPVSHLLPVRRDPRDCYIRISNRLDLPADQLDDIIIHEMIHYYIWYNKIADTGPHGKVFCCMMNDINRRHGRNITVRVQLDETIRQSDNVRNHHYILYTRWRNGQEGLTPVARTRIFRLHELFSGIPDVIEMKWFYTSDTYFNSYPRFQSARMLAVTEEMRTHLTTNSVECVCDGTSFRPKN